MIRGSEGSNAEAQVVEATGGSERAEDGAEDAWIDEDMPVDPSFKQAMHDVSEMIRRVFIYQSISAVLMSRNSLKGRWYRQTKAWRPRRQREYEAWDSLLGPMTDTYLQWKYGGASAKDAPSRAPVGQAADSASPLPNTQDASSPQWELSVFDLQMLRPTLLVDRSPESISPALDFMAHGFITKTVRSPDIAVSIATLELLYRLRQHKPSFSIEAFTKVVCDYYEVCSMHFFCLLCARAYRYCNDS